MSYFYGPVPSRRLGFSLGVDLIPKKVCSFDCLYCQTGNTTRKTLRRAVYVDFGRFEKELKALLCRAPRIDYLTISGSGEPTLHASLDVVIRTLKRITGGRYPVCVITNSSLLYRRDVRRELCAADVIIPSLDAVSPNIFFKINRPHHSLTSQKVIDGLCKLRLQFKGQLWLEIMLVKGINDGMQEIKKLKKAIDRINPDKVHLNIPIRPSLAGAMPPSPVRLEKIARLLGIRSKVVTAGARKTQRRFVHNWEAEIMKYLKRRPATQIDLARSFGVDKGRVSLWLKQLIFEGKVSLKGDYFTCND